MPHVPDPALEELEDATMIIEPPSNGAAPRSVIEALKAKRAEHAAEQSYDLEVPGHAGMLVLRCGPIPGALMNRLAERASNSKSKSAAVDANSDMLVAACREVWGRARPGGELVLLPDEDGDPLRLDRRLAETLQLTSKDGTTPDRARAVVLALYGLVPSPEMAIGQATTEYVEWATATNQEIDEELLGE